MAKIIKFPNAVIYNGKFYRANAPIEVEEAEEKQDAPEQGEAEEKPKKGRKKKGDEE